MAIPDYQTLMLPVLRLAAAGETDIRHCTEAIARDFQLTPDELQELLPSGKQTLLSNRTHWAKTYLVGRGACSTWYTKSNNADAGVRHPATAKNSAKGFLRYNLSPLKDVVL
ncbi:winged helix-turn-helix domain-containing protein [Defluviicoccus vanus]|uniref:Restriction system protein Mrr-like N-terminal domain-containing protein n=1 Tax=Defluviicoccus vanus TaxID=111831 RepID=A0A7H1N3I0_9PROT|nr:winged helix-turn-helix domain-containing protein [Defluviicoccus vanus]QNT70266.1 hypothetical protein HQ394_14175 [Defluviicoccus vanus]